MTRQLLFEKIEQLFKSYPTVNSFHMTADYQAFEGLHHAQSHSRTLKDDFIKTITREEMEDMKDDEVDAPIDENVDAPIDENVDAPIDENVDAPADEKVDVPADAEVVKKTAKK